MMFLCGQVNRIWHYWAGKYPGSVGILIGPSYAHRVPIDRWMPFALDNDAFMAWRNSSPWNESAWLKMLSAVKLTLQSPIWCAVPDVVADREATIKNWHKYSQIVEDYGWPLAFCVQDGMTEKDIPQNADVIFVGGTDGWKFPNLERWTKNFPRVHCARVNSPEMFEACERLGCESIDGTGWFRDPSRKDKLPAIESFLQGNRNRTPFLLTEIQQPTKRT